MFYPKSCNRCVDGDVTVDKYKNKEDGTYDLYCVQCGNRNFPSTSRWVALYMTLETRKKAEAKA